jgi:hypothetical protein
MRCFFVKLIPPRSDFMQTMSGAERALMMQHQAYWRQFAEKGWAIAYGPVADERGGYGAGFWRLPDDVDPRSLMNEDPTIKADAGFRYEVHPMPALAIGKI